MGALSNYTWSHTGKDDLKPTLYGDLKSNDPSMSNSRHGWKAMKTGLVVKPAGHCRTKGGLVASTKYNVSKGWKKKNHWLVVFWSVMWLRHKLTDSRGRKDSYWAWSTRSNLRCCNGFKMAPARPSIQPPRVSQNGSRLCALQKASSWEKVRKIEKVAGDGTHNAHNFH